MIKRSILLISAVMTFCFLSCAQGKKDSNNNKAMILVAYFSATGTTESVAKRIAAVSGGELLEIKPKAEYSSADLNWNDNSSRSSRESADRKVRPAITIERNDLSSYDVIFLGYPIWWDEAPRVINTFIETFNLAGKTIIPFATSGGSGITNSVKVLQRSYPDINWRQGKLLNRVSSATIEGWIEELGY